MHIFVAGPLTDLDNPTKTKAFYVRIAEICKKFGHDPFLAFLAGTDPIKNPDVSAKEVYRRDTEEIAKSDLLIAYVGERSTGTGDEIEYANTRNIPVILLFEKDKSISRMIRGNPAIKKEIIYSSDEDALKALELYFQSISPSNNSVS